MFQWNKIEIEYFGYFKGVVYYEHEASCSELSSACLSVCPSVCRIFNYRPVQQTLHYTIRHLSIK